MSATNVQILHQTHIFMLYATVEHFIVNHVMGISISSSPFAFHFMLVVSCVQSREETCAGFSERSLGWWKVCPVTWFKLGTNEFPGQLLCYRGPTSGQNVWMDLLAFGNIYNDGIEHPFVIWVGFEFYNWDFEKHSNCTVSFPGGEVLVLRSGVFKMLYVTCCCSDNHSSGLKLQLVYKNASPPYSLLGTL